MNSRIEPSQLFTVLPKEELHELIHTISGYE